MEDNQVQPTNGSVRCICGMPLVVNPSVPVTDLQGEPQIGIIDLSGELKIFRRLSDYLVCPNCLLSYPITEVRSSLQNHDGRIIVLDDGTLKIHSLELVSRDTPIEVSATSDLRL